MNRLRRTAPTQQPSFSRRFFNSRERWPDHSPLDTRHSSLDTRPSSLHTRPWSLAPLLACLGLLAVPSWLGAQTKAPAARPANRYLLIVETSHAMRSRAAGMLQAAHNLVAGDMNGQMQPGDSLGLWTFNSKLYAGRFPLQYWTPNAPRVVSERVAAFLQDQEYEKAARLQKVLPTMERIIKASEFITVVLISTGEEIHGTPFDEAINQSYKQWRSQQKDARMPYVTALRAQGGKIVAYTVTPAPWKVELPSLPPEFQHVKAEPKKPVSVSQTAPPAPVPPLIVSGKKPDSLPKPAAPVEPRPQSSPSAAPKPAAVAPAAVAQPPPPKPPEKSPPQPQAKATPSADKPEVRSAPSLSQSAGSIVPSAPPAQAPAGPGQRTRPTATPQGPAVAKGAAEAKVESKQAAGLSHEKPAPMTAAAPPAAFFSDKRIWLGVLAGGLLAGSGLWLWRSRARQSAHTSLITRSLSHEKEL